MIYLTKFKRKIMFEKLEILKNNTVEVSNQDLIKWLKVRIMRSFSEKERIARMEAFPSFRELDNKLVIKFFFEDRNLIQKYIEIINEDILPNELVEHTGFKNIK